MRKYTETDLHIINLKALYAKGILSKQQLNTLKGQALSGDIDGSKRGLDTICNRLTKRSESL